MTTHESVVSFPSDREINITRSFDAPRELVFKAWTDPEHLAKWWGPRGFTMTVHGMDVRPNGAWHFTFHGPDGRDYDNRLHWLEIVPPSRIVLRHESAPCFTVTASFEDEGGATRVTWRSVFDDARTCEAVKPFAVPGNRQTMDRLEERLEALKAGKPFTISRVFDAPRALVYRAWVERKRLEKWMCPRGFTIRFIAHDPVLGGGAHYRQDSPEGRTMWGKQSYRDLSPAKLVVTVQSFSDDKGGVVRHPMSATWPLQTLSTIAFSDEGGGTRVKVEWVPWNATAVERQTFQSAFDGMTAGWTGTLDQLEAYLQDLDGPLQKVADGVFRATRYFDAPREKVFEAWTKPDILKKWWAPKPFTVPRCEVDLKVGGKWEYAMRSPQGDEHGCVGVYREVEPGRKVAYTDGVLSPDGSPLFELLQSVVLEGEGDGTRADLTVELLSQRKGSEPYLAGMPVGFRMTLSNLRELLEGA